MKKRRLMKMAVLAMLLAMSGSGAYADNIALTGDASVSDVYDHQLAAGNRASTASNYATVYGYMQLATGEYATALGSGAMADDGNTYFNTASGSYSTTIGFGNTALIGRSTAIGYQNQASDEYTTAIGAVSMATTRYGTAVGYAANSGNAYATAVGNAVSATGQYATAVGVGQGATKNSASGENSSAFGYMNTAGGKYGQAFGSGNTVGALAEGGVSMGSKNTVSGINANAFGYNNQAVSDQTMTVGAENYAIGVAATGIGYSNQLTAANAMGLGVSNTASAEYAMAVGVSNSAVGNYAFALGAQNTSGAYSAVNKKTTNYTTAIGYGNVTGGSVGDATEPGSEDPGRTVALGYKNTTSVDDSVALGSQNVVAHGTQSAAFGYQNIVNNSTEAKGIAVAFGGQNVVTSYDETTPAAAFGYMNGYQEREEGDTAENNGIVDGIAIGYYNQGQKSTAKDWKAESGGEKLGTTIYPVVIGSVNTDNGIGTANTGNGIGYENTVTAGYLTATGIGTQNTATSTKAIAIGYQNTAGGTEKEEDDRKQNYAAIGVLNVATGENSGAFGYRNYAGAKNSVAMGAGNNYDFNETAAEGNRTYTASTTGETSVAIGYHNQAQTQDSTVFGYANKAMVGDTRQGQTEVGSGQNSLLGAKNTGYGYDAVALGYGNTTGKVLGSEKYGTTASMTYHTVAVGNANTATGVPGTTSTAGNTIAVGYANTVSTNYAKAFGVQNKVYGNNSTAFGYNNTIGATGNDNYPAYNSYASALGVSNTMARTYGSSNNIRYSTAVGVGNQVSFAYSIAAGYNNKLNYDYRNNSNYGNYNSLFGVGNSITNSYSSGYYDNNNSLVGFNNSINSSTITDNSLFGFSNRASSSYGAALGKSNTVSYMDIAIGNENTASTYSGTIGYKNSASGYNYGTTDNSYTYAIGGSNTITNYRHSGVRTGGILVGYDNYLNNVAYQDTLRPGSVKIGVGNKSSSYTRMSTVIGLNNSNASSIVNLTQIGSGNKAYGGDFGTGNAYGQDSTWLGQDNIYSLANSYSHYQSSVIGKGNEFGYYSYQTTAIGFSNKINYYALHTVIGTGNKVGNRYNAATGSSSQTTAVGSGNDVSGTGTSAFGYQNQIYQTAESSGNYNGGSYSSLIGIRNNLNQRDYGQNYYYSLGIDNKITQVYSTALGAENIVGQTSPSYNYDASSTPYNLAIGVSNQAGGTYIYQDGARANNSGYSRRSHYITTVGFENLVTGYTNLAYGYQNKVSGNQTMTSGYYRVDQSGAIGQGNIVKAGAAMSTNYTSNYYAGGYGSYALGHANTTQAPYSTVIGASNTVGGTRAYNTGATGNQRLNNTALGAGNTVGTSSYQDSYYASGYGTYTTAFNTYSNTGIGFQNTVGSNYVTAAGYGNTVINSTSNNTYTVTYSAALGANNTIRAIGEQVTSGNDQYKMSGEYSYAIGYGNTTQFAGSAALGFGNTVGSSTKARSVFASTDAYYNGNTAIGTSNTVGGLFVTDKSDTSNVKTYQIYGATGIGVSNQVKGEEGTAIGTSNVIDGSLTGHQDKTEANRSAAVGSRNRMYTTLDMIGTNETLKADVYNYALGNDNQLRGAGNLAVGTENNVGGTLNTQETADAANTALGGNNIVGGMYEDAALGIKGNGRYNLAAGFGNRVIGQENTAIGVSNYIEENSATLTDSKNLTQHNTLVGVSNTVNYATYAGSRMYNVGIGEGNTMRNGYDLAIGFANLVGGAYAENADNSDSPYHVALGSQNTVAGYGTDADGKTVNALRQTAVGSENKTYGRDSVVIGKSSVTGTEGEEEDSRESAAIGVRAVASSMKSLAVGVDVTASTVEGTVAVGQNSTVTAEKASAFGVNNQVSGTESLAVGTGNGDVSGARTVVIGTDNTSAVTADGVTTGTAGSVIFGVENTVTGDYAIAFGGHNTAAGGAIAAGYDSSALGEHALAMGYAQTVTADGAHGTAVGSGYERTEGSGASQTTYYYGTEVSGVSGAAFGVANLVSGNYATAVGAGYYRHTEIGQTGVDYFFQNTASGDYASAFGYLNLAEGEHSLAAGTGFVETVDDVDTLYANTASGDRAAALGYANQALANESLAAGGYSKTAETATGATAVGEGYVATIVGADGTTTTERRYNEAIGAGATALGFANTATGEASTAAGSLSKTVGKNATAVGVGIIKETKDGNGHITAVEYIENIARGIGSTALGYANDAVGDSSTTIGALSKATGTGATAAGSGYQKDDGTIVYNEADGDGAAAFGYANIARGNNATALGSTITVDGNEWVNQALSEGSTAIGSGNTAGATDKNKATAIGVTNLATGNESLAIGVSNAAISDAAIFLGNRNVTTVTVGGTPVASGGQNAIALGSDNQVAGNYGSALGTSNVVYGNYDVTIGSGASTGSTGAYRVAMGYQAQATGDKSIAIGYQAQAQAANSIAFGTNAQATFANSVAIGTDSVSTDSRRELEKTLETTGYGATSAAAGQKRTTYTVSFGDSTTTDNVTTGIVSRLTNITEGRETKDDSGNLVAGVGDTDAINVKQLKKYINTVPVFYDHRNADADSFTAEGSYITTNDHWLSTDFWQEDVTHGKDSTAYGYLANAKGETSSALGYNATTDEDAKDAIAMAGGTVTGEAGIAIGNGASAATGAAIGTGATSTDSAYAIGTGATASGTNVMVLGKGSTSTDEEYTISVGNGTDNYRIVNLANAQIDKTAKDYDETAAVNVGTMKAILDTMPEQEAIVIFDDGLNGRDKWRDTGDHWVGTDFELTGIAHGKDSTGYGYATAATGQNSTAVGNGYKDASGTIHYNTATANYASAFGTANTAGGLYALAAGVENTASGAYSAAVGYTSEATAAKATSIGYSTKAQGENSTAIGNYAIAYSKDSIAIGTAYNDTSSGMMITQAAGEGATAIGFGALANGARALSIGANQNNAYGADAVTIGAQNYLYGDQSAALGLANYVGDFSSSSAAPAAKSYALGYYNSVSGAQSIALGNSNKVYGTQAAAVGTASAATQARSLAAGYVALAAGTDAVGAGYYAWAYGNSSTALGYAAYATAANSAAIGYESYAVDSRVADDGTDAKINTVSFGHKATDIDPLTISESNPSGTAYGTALTSRLTHIADGVSDTDAANVRQLKESVIVDFDATYASGGGKWLSTDFGYEEKITHGENSTAYGYRANAVGDASVALGYQAYTASENGVALGAESVATGAVVSVGHKKGDEYQYIDDDGNVATGTYADALTRRITNVDEGTGDYDLVNVAQAKKAMKTAGIVKWDGVDGTNGEHYLATYFGDKDYYTPGENSSAYGYLTKATGEGSTAFGYAAWALADNGVALGAYSVANDNVISLGHAATDINPETDAAYGSELTRKIIHVADGKEGTDLVNVRTLKLTDPVKSGKTDGGTWLATSETATVSYTPGKYAAAYGIGSRATAENAVTFGYGAYATAKNSVALGAASAASDENVISIGHTTKDIDPTTINAYNTKGNNYDTDLTRRIVNVEEGVDDYDIVTVSQLTRATAEGGIVDYDTKYATSGNHYLSTYFDVKKDAVTRGENSASFGFGAFATAKNSSAIGYQAYATAENAIAVGKESVANVAGTFSVGHAKGDTYAVVKSDGTVAYGSYDADLTRIIRGLAFGEVPTDAVSYAQLKYTDPVKAGTTGTNHYLTTLDPTTFTPGENSVAYGLGTGQAKGAYASAKETVAFGLNATSVAQGSVALGANSYALDENVIALGHTTKQVDRTTGTLYTEDLNRRIVNVEDGVTNERDSNYHEGTDIVNVRILRENTKDAVGIVLTKDNDKNLYTELNDANMVTSGVNAAGYGKMAYAKNEASVAIGYKSYAGVDQGIALGAESVATEEDTVSIGHKKGDLNRYTDDTTGALVETTYEDDLFRRLTGLAFGKDNYDAVSVAQLARWDPVKTGTTDGVAEENHWLATQMGGTAFARGENSAAYGYGSAASGKTSVAFGLNAGAYGLNSVAIGSDSVAGDANTVSFGHKKGELDPERNQYDSALSRRIIHVAEGKEETDLINKSQLDAAVDLIQVIDWDKNRKDDGEKWLSTDFGKTVTHGYGSTAYGNYANAQGDYSTAFGYAATATAANSVALGRYSVASAEKTVSVGHSATDINPETGQAYGQALQQKITNVAAGKGDYDLVNKAQLESVDPVKTGTTNGEGHWLATMNIGEEVSWTPGKDSVAYGFTAMALGENSTAFGALTRVDGENSVALGAFSATNEDNVVSIGHKSDDTNVNGETFGDTLNRRIVNVAKGENDTDLVTVAQLDLAAGTSGGVVEFGDYKTGGDYHLSTYITEDGKATNNSTSAAYGFQANVAADATNGAALGYGATVSVKDGIAIGAGSVASDANTISFGDAETKLYRKITNAAAGDADTDTDAVTVGQLHQYYLPKSGSIEDGTDNKWIATTYGTPTNPGKNSAAYGDGASAEGENSVAYGYGATATHDNSVALGAGSVTTADDTVSVGDASQDLYRRIMYADMSENPDAYDAVTLEYVEKQIETKGSGVVKFDTDWRNTGNHRLSIQFDEANPKDETDPTKTGKDAVGFGFEANAAYEKSVAFGYGASVEYESAAAIGAGSVVYEANTVSVGAVDAERKITNLRAGTASTDMVNVSQLNAVKSLLEANGIKQDTNLGERVDKVSEGASTAKDILDKNGIKEVQEGEKTIVERIEEAEKLVSGATKGTEVDPDNPDKVKYKDNQTAIGSGSAVDGKDSSVYGYKDQVTGENSTGMGTTNIVTGDKSTGIGSNNRIDGDQSSAYGFDNHVTGNDALAIGSGNEARGDGTVAIGQGAWATGEDGVAIGSGAKAVENSVAIGAGSKATESGTVSFGDGTDDGNRRLTNIKEGKDASDVATYGVVKDLEDRANAIKTSTDDSTFDRLDSLIDTSEEHIAKVGAGAAAIAALHPLEYDPSEKISFALGYGNYQGKNAMAVGAFVRPNEFITISLGGSMGNGENLMNSSISFALGSGPSGLAARSKAALAKQVNEQDEKIAARDEEIARLRSLISQLEAMAETDEQKTMAHQMVVRSESAELEELRSMAQQLVATASAAQLRSIVYQLSPTGGV